VSVNDYLVLLVGNVAYDRLLLCVSSYITETAKVQINNIVTLK